MLASLTATTRISVSLLSFAGHFFSKAQNWSNERGTEHKVKFYLCTSLHLGLNYDRRRFYFGREWTETGKVLKNDKSQINKNGYVLKPKIHGP